VDWCVDITVRMSWSLAHALIVFQVQRAYTPVSRPGEKGFIDLLVKIYFPSDKFPGSSFNI
jgi:Oxidoreductase FAD-binding domain